MSNEFINYEKKGRIAYVTITRPERMNSLHIHANEEMHEAFVDFRDDPEVWVAILTGQGERAFSAGNDLKYTAEQVERPQERLSRRVGFGGIDNHFQCWKPIIAAINGYALGGGLELAMSCDILIAAEHAMLGLPEARVGLVPGSGVQRLPRQIPLKIAMGMMLTGRHITAQEALRLGLVNEVVPLAELMPTAERWANQILEVAPLSARAIKQMTMTGLDSPLDVALNRTYSEWQNAQASDDVIEGPKAFSEKRKPNWTGA